MTYEQLLIENISTRDKMIAKLEAENEKLKIAEAQSYGMYFELLFSPNEPPKSLEAHNLRQQAKGIRDYVNSRALILKESSWFAEDPPSIEYLYAAGFGLGESQQALRYADNLEEQDNVEDIK